MSKDKEQRLIVASSPHVHSGETIPKIMWTVFFCLLPSGIMSVYVFGMSTVWIILSAIIGAVATEWCCCTLQKKKLTIGDGSAVLTGLLVAYNVPPQSPLWLSFLGAGFAILFGKILFGGLGFNIFNPALIGRVFLMASFPVLMTRWPALTGVDAVTAPTPLAIFKDGFAQSNMLGSEVVQHSYRDLFFGFRGGCIGEACIAALLLGAIYLIFAGYISWYIPVSYIGTVAVFTWIFAGEGFFRGDFMFHILAGGLVLGAFYMATDYVTGPVTKPGRLIFGMGCGLLTGIIRLWGGYPEGVSYSILIMNALTPLIDRFVVPKRFGNVK
ncbi:MAG: RnfABCDGE type electron transport complex subunit D [Candidatus Omnitrophota bacterium]